MTQIKADTIQGGYYRLGDYVLKLGDRTAPENSYWHYYHDDNGRVQMYSGRVEIDAKNDVIWLGCWRCHYRDTAFKTLSESDSDRNRLQPWTGTRWAVKLQDIGNATVVDCRTGKAIDADDPELVNLRARLQT
jgi:hypothetical protein